MSMWNSFSYTIHYAIFMRVNSLEIYFRLNEYCTKLHGECNFCKMKYFPNYLILSVTYRYISLFFTYIINKHYVFVAI